MATVGQQLLQPEAGWKRIDDTHPFIKYEGTWVNGGSGSVNAEWNGTMRYSQNINDKIRIIFYGTKFRLIAMNHNSHSQSIRIKIDGEEHFFSQYHNSATPTYRLIHFEKLGLERDYHIVEIDSIVTTNVRLDAIDIDEDGTLIRYDYFEDTGLSEPIRKYGHVWLTFDEESGNALDKLGSSYVGTLYNNAQRSEGWNNKGKSITLNGTNQYVHMTNPISKGEKTIRFKFKPLSTPNDTKVIFSTSEGTSTYRGIGLQLTKDMTLNLFGYNGSNYNISLQSQSKLDVNKWCDIILTFDGELSGSKVSMYVNGLLENTTRLTANENTYSNVLMLGRYPSATYYVNGQIDEFQVLLKTLTPENFDKKVVVIKTANNKVITLPNLNGRVRELPSEDELDLVNLGYNWKDADNSASSNGMNLTYSTTEYEIVGKNNSSLGNGKVFSLPIENFKTVTVENND